MSEHTKPKTAFLMKLQPLKPMDRFKQPMQYSFEQKNPKTSEIKPNLPPIDFSPNPEIPVFMAPYEQYASQKNPDFFKINFERRLDRGNEEELRQLFMPKPPRKSRYCGICTEYYEEYYAHVTSESHNAKFTKHPFLPQIYYEMEKVHGEFLKGRDKYVAEVPSSPEDSPTFSTNRKREYAESNNHVCISDSEHGGKGKSKDNHSYKDETADDNSKTRTARKEPYQAQKTTIKKDLKVSLFDSRSQLSDDHEVLNKENKGVIIMHNTVRYSEDLFGNRAKEDDIKCESPKNPIQRMFMKLKYEKKDVNPNKEAPKFLTFNRLEGRVSYHPENDTGAYPFTTWIPNNLEESKSSTTTQTFPRAENDDYESKFQRRNPGKNLKRHYDRSITSSEDEIIFDFKKVKITDSQTQSQTAESETVKLDFNNKDKWKNLKSSVAGLFGDLKGTVSKIYDFWKKNDP